MAQRGCTRALRARALLCNARGSEAELRKDLGHSGAALGAEMNVSTVCCPAKPEVNRKPAESTSIANVSAAIRL